MVHGVILIKNEKQTLFCLIEGLRILEIKQSATLFVFKQNNFRII